MRAAAGGGARHAEVIEREKREEGEGGVAKKNRKRKCKKGREQAKERASFI